MKMKIIWEDFNFEDDMYLFKEIGEIPYYFSKIYGYNAVISGYSGNKTTWRDIKLLKNSSIFPRLNRYIRIIKNAKNIDILYLIHIDVSNFLAMCAYKLGGGKGKIYLKCDLEQKPGSSSKKDRLKWENMPVHHRIFRFLSKNIPDIYTVETKKAYDRLKNSYYRDLIQKNKIFILPNGFDPLILKENSIIQKNISEKERIIITVGRLGTAQKNTELFLNILEKINLKDWKVYLIGPQTDTFKEKIKNFYARHPEKTSSVFFTGPISNKELYDYYNRSRVFVLTSKDESFAFVLLEAAFMKNYLISTNVGILTELLDSVNGFSVETTDFNICQKMTRELERIINLSEDELNKLYHSENLDKWTWEAILRNNEGIQKLLL